MAYMMLAGAIMLEVVAATLLERSDGFAKPALGIGALVLYAVSLALFSRVLLTLNLSIAYATWCACGIVATTLISVFFLHDTITPMGVAGIALLVVGVIMVNLAGTSAA